jgi:SAM-dependent methyltransferase
MDMRRRKSASAAPAIVDSGVPKLYGVLASWWTLLSPPDEYEEEAAFYERILLDACEEPPRTLLELGSGGGNNASYLKQRFQMVLVDRAPAMLEVSRALNPECEHIAGDMRAVRLGRKFDCVFIHDAIMYMTTESDLRQAFETAFVHCRPGGAALFAPDFVCETFRSLTDHGGYDGEDGRGLRYLEWSWDPDPKDTTYFTDMVYVLRARDGAVRVEHDRHIEGLFARADWLGLLAEVGFVPEVVPFDHSELEPGTYELFIGRKPGTRPARDGADA